MSIETIMSPTSANPNPLGSSTIEEAFSKAELANPFFLAQSYDLQKLKPYQWFFKRAVDITASSLGILALLPLLLTVAIAIRLETAGNIIYKQKRIGLHGRTFNMYKFRSMRQNADQLVHQLMEKSETGKGMFKMFNDPRVTRIGKIIRKYSIDELPQLLNVIKGDMSLVGPRPPIEIELQHYKNWHYIRFATLPGLTGIWQVSGRSKIKEFDTVVKMDYQYINSWNLLLDFKLLLKTFPVVIGGMDTA